MMEVLGDERSHGCESWLVSDDDTTPFLPSVGSAGVPYTLLPWIGWTFAGFTVGISWRPIHFVTVDWMDI